MNVKMKSISENNDFDLRCFHPLPLIWGIRIAVATAVLFAIGCGVAAELPPNGSYVYPPWGHTWGVIRATPFHLRVFLGDKVHFDDPEGLACARLLSWDDSTKPDENYKVTVYGVNSGANCIIFNRSMFALGIYGLEPGQPPLDRPWGIAADRTGRVYVADRGHSRIVRLFNSGKDLHYVESLGGVGDDPGQFLDPRGVALIPDGRLFVTDAGIGRVTVFDDSGAVLDTWDGFVNPDAIAAVGPGELDNYYPGDAFVVVVDSLNRRVRKLDLAGHLIKEVIATDWGALVTPNLAYCAIDYHNQILITDRSNGCIHKLDRNLNYLTQFGESGSGQYQFDEPRGIALNRHYGQIFVAEREGAQYLWVGVEVTKFVTEVVGDSDSKDLHVDFRLTEPALVDLDLYDNIGRFLGRLVQGRGYGTGENRISWGLTLPQKMPDGTPLPDLPPEYQAGGRLPKGKYQVRATFRAVYSSREVFSREKQGGFQVWW